LADRTAIRHLARPHPAAEGHFPGNPIIPGAVLLREIVAAVSTEDSSSGGVSTPCREIISAKFHHPVRPGDMLVINWTEGTGGEVRFSCSVEGSERAAVTGSLRLARP
jgi:3-hydroxyacyl-[acyl-carrier-protein] dehydratase